jgi:hypothetical protein
MKTAILACCICALATPALAGGMRDPTRPPQRASDGARAEPTPVLSAVYSGGSRRGAIVNGEYVRAGSTVGPFLIEEVLADGVRYRYEGHAQELHLPRSLDMIKKPTVYRGPATSGVNP